jgi:hypothetical protein
VKREKAQLGFEPQPFLKRTPWTARRLPLAFPLPSHVGHALAPSSTPSLATPLSSSHKPPTKRNCLSAPSPLPPRPPPPPTPSRIASLLSFSSPARRAVGVSGLSQPLTSSALGLCVCEPTLHASAGAARPLAAPSSHWHLRIRYLHPMRLRSARCAPASSRFPSFTHPRTSTPTFLPPSRPPSSSCPTTPPPPTALPFPRTPP